MQLSEGDSQALDAMGEIARWLGLGLANLVVAFDPEVIVIGGGVSAAGDLLLEPTREAFAASLVGSEYRGITPIVMAGLGENAGVVGAALAAMEGTE